MKIKIKKPVKDKIKDKIIEDGFGNRWYIKCPICNQDSMEIVRPGKVQCSNCESIDFGQPIDLSESV